MYVQWLDNVEYDVTCISGMAACFLLLCEMRKFDTALVLMRMAVCLRNKALYLTSFTPSMGMTVFLHLVFVLGVWCWPGGIAETFRRQHPYERGLSPGQFLWGSRGDERGWSRRPCRDELSRMTASRAVDAGAFSEHPDQRSPRCRNSSIRTTSLHKSKPTYTSYEIDGCKMPFPFRVGYSSRPLPRLPANACPSRILRSPSRPASAPCSVIITPSYRSNTLSTTPHGNHPGMASP